MEQYGFVRLHAREGERNLRGGGGKRGTMYRAPTGEWWRVGASAVRFLERVDALLDQPREMARTEIG